jgi:hypothetical protein
MPSLLDERLHFSLTQVIRCQSPQTTVTGASPACCMQVRFEDQGITSIAFNLDLDDLLAYTGAEFLAVRMGTCKPSRQRLSTLLIAFENTTAHCLKKQQLHQSDVSLGGTVAQLIDACKWRQAYQVASMGVTMDVWDRLGNAALVQLDLDVARRCFIRTQNFQMLNLIHRLGIMKQSAVPEGVLVGEVLAHQVDNCASTHANVTQCAKQGQLSCHSIITSYRASLRKQQILLPTCKLSSASWKCGEIFGSSIKQPSGQNVWGKRQSL